jgi:hypothetical protein
MSGPRGDNVHRLALVEQDRQIRGAQVVKPHDEAEPLRVPLKGARHGMTIAEGRQVN